MGWNVAKRAVWTFPMQSAHRRTLLQRGMYAIPAVVPCMTHSATSQTPAAHTSTSTGLYGRRLCRFSISSGAMYTCARWLMKGALRQSGYSNCGGYANALHSRSHSGAAGRFTGLTGEQLLRNNKGLAHHSLRCPGASSCASAGGGPSTC